MEENEVTETYFKIAVLKVLKDLQGNYGQGSEEVRALT
jgi:hypothetical protein